MNHLFKKKKESGAQGRKRRKLEAEEAQKLLAAFFQTPGASSSARRAASPAAGLLERDGGSSADASRADEESQSDESECDELNCEAATEDVDTTGGEDNNGGDDDGGDVEFIDEIEPDAGPGQPDGVAAPRTVIPEVIEQRDIGLLKFDRDTGKAVVPDALRTEIVQLGLKYFQNGEGPFLPTNNRSMNETWFASKSANGRGEEVTRSWLAYSPSKKSAFCICCLLYSRSDHQSSLEQESGFNQWKAPERIGVHENAKNHRECFARWRETEKDLRGKFREAEGKERQKWRDVLTRVLHCVKFVAAQNLALPAHEDSLRSDDGFDTGDFLGLMRLLADFDPVAREHVARAENRPGSAAFLSPSVHDEFVHAVASAVRRGLLRSVRKAKYYGLVFESSAGPASRELVSEVVRYVDVDFDRRTVRVRESFLGFVQISRTDAGGFVEDILRRLEKDGMELRDCRSLCLDDAAMAGHRSGVLRRISELNRLATFVNRDNGSLNLAAVNAAKQDAAMVAFFGTVEALREFFSRSARRWERLGIAAPAVAAANPEPETAWSARTEALNPVHGHLHEILEVLRRVADDGDESGEARSDARRLRERVLSRGFLTLLGFWNRVLARVDGAQRRLRDPGAGFRGAAPALKALRDRLDDERESLVGESLEEGLGLCRELNVEVEGCPRDAGFTAREETERVVTGTLERVRGETDERFGRSRDADASFGFLLDAERLCHGADGNDLRESCERLGASHRSDVDGPQLYEDVLDCRAMLSRRADVKVSRPEELLEFIAGYGDESLLPNLRVAVQMALTVAVSVAGCEGALGKPALIRSYLGAEAGRGGLGDLALLGVEREETDGTDFEHIVERFASVKATKGQPFRPPAHPSNGCSQPQRKPPERRTPTRPKPTRPDPPSAMPPVGKLLHCLLCKWVLVSPAALQDHMKKHGRRSEPDYHQCPRCPYSTCCRRTLANHLRTHTGEKPYACQACGKRFAEMGPLAKHRRTHTGERPYRCAACGRAFAHLGTLRAHERALHAPGRAHACRLCGEASASPAGARAHRAREHAGRKPFACGECGRAFASAGYLARHAASHAAERPYVCTACEGRAFAHAKDLRSHQRVHLRRRKGHRCGRCGRAYTRLGALRAHERLHAGDGGGDAGDAGDAGNGGLEGPDCPEDSASGHGAREKAAGEMSDPREEKPVLCPECGDAFDDADALRRHRRSHVEESRGDRSQAERPIDEMSDQREEKPVLCRECGDAFDDVDALRRHRRSHDEREPVLCFECGEAFADPGSLRRHLRRHAGDSRGERSHTDGSDDHDDGEERKPLLCPECGDAFDDVDTLRRHQSSHDEDSEPRKVV